MDSDDEERQLRSVALKNAGSILAARQRAERELVLAKEALEQRTRELAHALSMMRATFESTTDGIVVFDAELNVADFNEKFLQMWGLEGQAQQHRDRAELLDAMCAQFAAPTLARTELEAIMKSSVPYSFETIELLDGRVFERHSQIQLLEERNVGRVWSFRDISASRRAEVALQEETRVLEVLNQTGAALASQLDLQSLVQAVTDAATELSGAKFGAFFYNQTDASGFSYQLYALSGAPREAFDKFGYPRATPIFAPTFRGEAAIRLDDVLADPRYGQLGLGMPAGHLPVRSYLAVPVVSRSGKVFGGLFFGHPKPGVFTARAERIIVGIAAQAGVGIDNAHLYEAAQQSADERQRLLDSERAARAATERMSELKDHFLANLSHELRTPLNAILGWTQILRRGARGEADLQKGLETIERNARVQTQLIEDLLDMSRIVSGKVRLDIQATEPSAFIEAAIETVRPAADARQIRIERVLDPRTGPIPGDPSRLQQVMWNLLSNAIKFTAKGGKVQIVLSRVNSHIEISVADTGVGISPDFLPHIFERFRQADASSTRRYGGLGLGLSIVKYLVELHGGTVSASSPGEGHGTSFCVALPILVVHHTLADEPREHPSAPGQTTIDPHMADLSGVKVLVVDDEADARDMLKRVLGDCGAEVATAASAVEALALLASDTPDVLISDIGMPDVDGFELLRQVRAWEGSSRRRIAAVALTAFARSEDRTRALRAGFSMHVAKPVEPTELVATVASLAGRG